MGGKETWFLVGAVESVGSVPEKVENIIEALWVELGCKVISQSG